MRKRFTVRIPIGEEGVLDEMLDQLAERYKNVWGGMETDDQGWRYRALHYALHVAIEAPDPSEEGD